LESLDIDYDEEQAADVGMKEALEGEAANLFLRGFGPVGAIGTELSLGKSVALYSKVGVRAIFLWNESNTMLLQSQIAAFHHLMLMPELKAGLSVRLGDI
jgi:hypothetical protein